MKKIFVVLAMGLGVAGVARAELVLNLNPNTDGDWVFHLTGNHNGSGLTFYDNINQNTAWNQTQGGAGGAFTADLVEPIGISGHVNQSIIEAYDVGDGVVVGDTFFKGFATDDGFTFGSFFALKLDSSFGTSISDFTSTTFDETLVLKPSDKGSFSTVWNAGTYTDGDFRLVISNDVVPEPAAIGLLGTSCSGLFLLRSLRRRKTIGASVLPVRREHRCDVFCSESEWTARMAADSECGPEYFDMLLGQAWEAVLESLSGFKKAFAKADRTFWDYMVARHERRMLRRKEFRMALRKKMLDGLDSFLALIMK